MEKKEGIGVSSARLLSSLYMGQIAGVIITVATFVAATRIMGPALYGAYTFAFGFSAFVDFVGNFGIGTYLARNLARYSYRKDERGVVKTLMTGYSILVPISLVLTLVGIAASGYVARSLFPELGIAPLTLMLASSIIIFSTVESTTVHALIGLSRGKLASFVGVFVDLLQLISVVTLLLAGYGLNGAIVGMLIGYAAGAVAGILLIYSSLEQKSGLVLKLPNLGELRNALRFVVPMSLNNVLNFGMSNFAILYLSLFVSKVVLGNYGAALKGLGFVAIFYSTMSTALLPMFTKAGASRKRKDSGAAYNLIIRYSLMLTLPFIVYMAVMAGPGVRLLLSSSYKSTGLFLSLIAAGAVIDAFQYYISNLLISRGITMPLVKSILVSNIAQFIALVALVPRFGVPGAVVSIFFIGPLIESALFVMLARRLMSFRLEYVKTGLIFAGNILLALPLYLALLASSGTLALLLGAVVLVLAYPAILIFIGAIGQSDLKIITGISEKIPPLRAPAAFVEGYMRVLLKAKGSYGS